MKKLLYCASTLSHLKNFHLPHIKALSEADFSVFTCAEQEFLFENTAGSFALPFEKRFLSFQNLKAVFTARKLLLRENFDVISLNTSLAAAVIRAALLTMPKKRRPKVVYICHGFLFGEKVTPSSLRYSLPEKLLAHLTDILAVMNDEDARLAKRYHLCENLRRINGMGLPEGRYRIPDEDERTAARKSLGIAESEFVFLCVGEFSSRKNQQAVIRAFAKSLSDMPNARLIFAGEGALLSRCKSLAKELNIAEKVSFSGQKSDVLPLYFAADAAVSASKSEGLPFSIMESLCCGLPAILSDIKGHRDLKNSGGNIVLFDSGEKLSAAMKEIYRSKDRFPCDMSRYMLPAVLSEILSLYNFEKED